MSESYLDIGNGLRSKVEEGSGEKAGKIATLVSGQLQKRVLEKQLSELMRKRDGGKHLHVTNQVKRRRTLTVATNVDFEIPDFQDFCPFYSLPEKQGTTDWRYKLARPSSYHHTIEYLFRPEAHYVKAAGQLSCIAAAAVILSASVARQTAPPNAERNSHLIGNYGKPEDQAARVREIASLKKQRTSLAASIFDILHGGSSLAEKASLSLIQDTLKNTVPSPAPSSALTDILKYRPRLSRAKLVWGVTSKPEFTFRLALSKRQADAAAYTAQATPEWVFQEKQVRQSDKARVQCGYDVWPQKCNLETCTYLHENGHTAGEALACRKALHAMGVSKLLDVNPSLKEGLKGLQGEYTALFKEVRDDEQNNKKMRALLARILEWGEENKLLGVGSGQAAKDVDAPTQAAEEPTEQGGLSVLEDLVKLCGKMDLTPLELECLKASDAPVGLEEAYTVTKLAVLVSRLPKLDVKGLVLHSFEPKLEEALPAFQDFENALARHPSCLSIYVLYIEALARKEGEHTRDVAMTAVLNVIARGLGMAPSIGLQGSQTTFALIMLGVFFRQCCDGQGLFLEGLLDGQVLNMETVLKPKHFAALPVIYAAVKGKVFPECISGLWRLVAGMPFAVDWKGVKVAFDPKVAEAFVKFIETHTYKDLDVKDSLIINYVQYLSAAGKGGEAATYLTKSLKDNPNRLALFKELSDLLDSGAAEGAVIGFDSFEMYERIIDKEVTTKTDPHWHGIASLFYINLLLKHNKVDKALAICTGEGFEEPYASIMSCVAALLQCDEARFRNILKNVVGLGTVPAVQEHVLKEILMYKTPSHEDVGKFVEVSLDKASLTIPGVEFGEWSYFNTCDDLVADPYSVLEDTRPGRVFAAIENGTPSEEVMFTDCSFLPSASVRARAAEELSESDDE